jgi:hypothetical protein
MSNIVLPGPSLIYVQWGCRRCGHRGGVARTTIPLGDARDSEEMMRVLLQSLRTKLVRVHQRGQRCIASPDDFLIDPHVPRGMQLAARL